MLLPAIQCHPKRIITMTGNFSIFAFWCLCAYELQCSFTTNRLCKGTERSKKKKRKQIEHRFWNKGLLCRRAYTMDLSPKNSFSFHKVCFFLYQLTEILGEDYQEKMLPILKTISSYTTWRVKNNKNWANGIETEVFIFMTSFTI